MRSCGEVSFSLTNLRSVTSGLAGLHSSAKRWETFYPNICVPRDVFSSDPVWLHLNLKFIYLPYSSYSPAVKHVSSVQLNSEVHLIRLFGVFRVTLFDR